MMGRVTRRTWVVPQSLALIVASVVGLPLLYAKSIIDPGYELLIAIPLVIVAIYLVIKNR